MQNQPQKHTSKKRSDPEVLLCLWLALLAIFEVILVTVLLVRAYPKQDTVELPKEEETVTDPLPDAPKPSLPVFSGGVLPTPPSATAATLTLGGEIDSQYAILINAETGEIVAQKGADVAFSPASMTKVMTLIVACENLSQSDLSRRLAMTQEIATYVTSGEYKGTECALPRELNGISCIGDEYRIDALLYGIGVMSAADCTYMIAKEIGGSEEGFVAMMNAKAQELGLSDKTHFDNAVGFDSEGNQTTARDMAMIMAYAMQSDLIADILMPRDDRYGIKAYYKDDFGVEKSYDVWLTCSFESRMKKYPSFSLSTVKLNATKTGYTEESFIVCSATGKTSADQYILVLGNQETAHTTITQKFAATMKDIEYLYNTHAK